MGDRKPNIKSLARHRDVEGLVDATSYRDVKQDSQGTTTDAGAHVRAEAILALGELGPESGGDVIAAALRDPADRVRCAAVRVLHAREQSTILARALRWLPADNGSSRTFAIQALGDLQRAVGDGKPNIHSLARRKDVEGLMEAASYRDVKHDSWGATIDSGVDVRGEAILALGELGPDSGGEAVAAALRDPADGVRCAAVRVLHAREQSTVLAQALRWLPADSGNSRTFAIQALVDLRTLVSPWTVVDALLHREDEELLGEADAQLIVSLLEDEGVEAGDATIRGLILALGAERGIVVDRAAELLVRLAPASVEALVAELKRGSVAADAAYVLGRIRDPEAAEALLEALWHADPRVRAESAAALGELGDPDIVRPLLQATRDPDHGVRVQAAMALDRIGNAAVIVGVAAMLEPLIDDALRSRQRRPRTQQPNGGPPESPSPPRARTQNDR